MIYSTDDLILKVRLGTTEKTFDRPVSLDDVKAIAREGGVKKFTLDPEAITFPYSGDITIIPFYEAK